MHVFVPNETDRVLAKPVFVANCRADGAAHQGLCHEILGVVTVEAGTPHRHRDICDRIRLPDDCRTVFCNTDFLDCLEKRRSCDFEGGANRESRPSRLLPLDMGTWVREADSRDP